MTRNRITSLRDLLHCRTFELHIWAKRESESNAIRQGGGWCKNAFLVLPKNLLAGLEFPGFLYFAIFRATWCVQKDEALTWASIRFRITFRQGYSITGTVRPGAHHYNKPWYCWSLSETWSVCLFPGPTPQWVADRIQALYRSFHQQTLLRRHLQLCPTCMWKQVHSVSLQKEHPKPVNKVWVCCPKVQWTFTTKNITIFCDKQ